LKRMVQCSPEAAPCNPGGVRGQREKEEKKCVGKGLEMDGAMLPRSCSNQSWRDKRAKGERKTSSA
jgi:hypothetical protein